MRLRRTLFALTATFAVAMAGCGDDAADRGGELRPAHLDGRLGHPGAAGDTALTHSSGPSLSSLKRNGVLPVMVALVIVGHQYLST